MPANSGTSRRVAIIGGGITGLAAAHRLYELAAGSESKTGLEVTVFEAGDRAGGVIDTVRVNDSLLELGPDSILTQKPWAIDLCRRLGIENRIIHTNEKNRRTYIVYDGKLHPLPEGFSMLAPTQWWPFLTSSLFTPLGKLRMAMDLILPRGASGQDESLSDFVVRRLGKEALDRVAQPMIGGVYTADPARLSLRATMPRFQEMEEKHGSVIKGMLAERRKARQALGTKPASVGDVDTGARYSMFISLDGGLKLLVDSLIAKLPPGSLKLRSAVSQVRPLANDRWEIALSDGTITVADAVIIALPAYAAGRALADVNSDLSEQLQKIEYASAVVINLVYNRAQIKHRLDGFGFVVPQSERLSLIAASFSSVKYSARTAPDRVVLRAFMGGALMPEVNELDDRELVLRATTDLAELLEISGNPAYSLVSRFPRTMPQYHLGHLDLIKRIESQIADVPGLELAGNAYYGVGIPDCIHSGEMSAARIFQFLTAS